MLEKLLPYDIYDALCNACDLQRVTEIRIRINMPIRYCLNGEFSTLYVDNIALNASKYDIEYILLNATNRSLYAFNDELQNGYLVARGGIRIGVAGECITNSGSTSTIKNISYLTMRLPHEVKGVARQACRLIGDYRHNVLIISPPGEGKTTFLRDYVRINSNNNVNVLLIDERMEVAATLDGVPSLDVGINTDVISNSNKMYAYKMAIRSLNPDLIATDEVFGESEVNAILDAIRCGVYVVATLHARNINEIKNSKYSILLKHFDYAICLSSKGKNRQSVIINLRDE